MKPKRGQRSETEWRSLIEKQQQSGQTILSFCRRHELCDHSFYEWRKRLSSKEKQPIRFAVVEASAAAVTNLSPLELHLSNGDLLRIPCGIDPATLRTVLGVLREQA